MNNFQQWSEECGNGIPPKINVVMERLLGKVKDIGLYLHTVFVGWFYTMNTSTQ